MNAYNKIRNEAFTPENKTMVGRVTRRPVKDCFEFLLDGEISLGLAAPSRDGWMIEGKVDGEKWFARVHFDGVAKWLLASYRLNNVSA